MDELRKKVDAQIKKVIVPEIRQQGFKGSYPHFRKIYDNGRVDYLSFQFNKWGGSFIAEMAVAYPYRGGKGNFYYWNEITPEFLKKSHYAYTSKRLRIEPSEDEWFEFDDQNYEETVEHARRRIAENYSYFDRKAEQLSQSWRNTDAE